MLNDKTLESYIHNFYGYGNPRAPYWFIGMEEGGGEDIQNIERRVGKIGQSCG